MSLTNNCHFSAEFFPPKTDAAAEKLARVQERLALYNPDFFSVTYGAGGSTREDTQETVLKINRTGASVAPHLSFGSDTQEKISQLLQLYKSHGIDRLVALRGDVPSGMGNTSGIHYANELVTFIRETTGDHFHIEVAAYPEAHPESTSVEMDLHYFKMKVDAGANGAITQYFYNADAYFRFVDQCTRLGITIPIVPGIMPITNYSGLRRFSDNCGAEIPRWICKQLESYGDDKASIESFGEEVVTKLCERLLAGGAPGFHFYTMNKSKLTIRICENLGIERTASC
jgi:methylenetetrahydrofolate reductase (NADPH)